MVRDLVDLAVDMVKAEKADEVKEKAALAAEERLLDLLLPPTRPPMPGEEPPASDHAHRTRDRFREQLHGGALDDRTVEIEAREAGIPPFIAGNSVEDIGQQLKEMFSAFQGRTRTRRVKVPEAMAHLLAEEQGRLVDMESVSRIAVQRVEHAGIIFIDEIDKIASRSGVGAGGGHGPDVSREGVQRDILPIIEGTTVNSKHGMVKTDHVLFIAAGAFHVAKPSDLIPELQGRFPIRVELESLTRDDFVRILTEPRNALIAQYTALLATEGVDLRFTRAAVERIADFAARVNDITENIGARRLHTVMERLLDELSFDAPDRPEKAVTIDDTEVERTLADVVENEDLSRYIL
jgi:ATP-dependent HslUV protease ATP-binding subunit HslU